MRTAVFLSLVLAASGCGTSPIRPAAPTVTTLDWVDKVGPPGRRMSVHVHTLTVQADRWIVHGRVTNETSSTLGIGRIHRLSRANFGIAEFRPDQRAVPPQLIADRFVPPLPEVLRPGASWEGTFSGRGRLPRGRALHIAFGTFFATPQIRVGNRLYSRFTVYTDESVRLP